MRTMHAGSVRTRMKAKVYVTLKTKRTDTQGRHSNIRSNTRIIRLDDVRQAILEMRWTARWLRTRRVRGHAHGTRNTIAPDHRRFSVRLLGNVEGVTPWLHAQDAVPKTRDGSVKFGVMFFLAKLRTSLYVSQKVGQRGFHLARDRSVPLRSTGYSWIFIRRLPARRGDASFLR